MDDALLYHYHHFPLGFRDRDIADRFDGIVELYREASFRFVRKIFTEAFPAVLINTILRSVKNIPFGNIRTELGARQVSAVL